MNLWEKVSFSPNNKKKQSPHRTLRVQEVETPRSFGKSAHDGGKDVSRGQLKCDGTRAETRFRLSAKRTSPFKSAGAVAKWLRCCATNRNVVGSIPAGVIGIFH